MSELVQNLRSVGCFCDSLGHDEDHVASCPRGIALRGAAEIERLSGILDDIRSVCKMNRPAISRPFSYIVGRIDEALGPEGRENE